MIYAFSELKMTVGEGRERPKNYYVLSQFLFHITIVPWQRPMLNARSHKDFKNSCEGSPLLEARTIFECTSDDDLYRTFGLVEDHFGCGRTAELRL